MFDLMLDRMKGGLRAVSIFEAGKGVLVLLLSLSLYTFEHHDFRHIAAAFERRWHLDLSLHIPGFIRMFMLNLTESRLHLIVFVAVIYVLMRFIEAYGLWFERRWAEWFALWSGGVYLPVELYELTRGFSWLKFGFLFANLLIVLYMVLALRRG
ncbi:MAG: DUF2127 domain-containing protein [Chlorobaculum sp.]|nr:DUF2127 domain-containing protein [Chlorobaculum sp.]